MQIPKNIVIKDANGKTTAFLSSKADGLKDPYVDCRLNGESTFEFMLPATSEKIKELTPECEIWAGDRVYSLLNDDAVDTVRDEKNTLWTKAMAVERWKKLETSYVEPSLSNDPTTPLPAELAVIIVGGGSNLSGGTYATGTAAHALYSVLNGSGWSLGTCDVTGIHDLEMEKASRLEIIKEIQNIWGGYLVWDSVNKIVHLRDANTWQPYHGFQIRYKKNLKYITRTDSNKLITKLYAFGHDDLGFANINGDKIYVTNFSYTPVEYIGIYKNQDIYDQQELLEKATAELSLICCPRHLYKVKIVDIRVLPEYEHEEFSLGDMIDIIDPDVAPDSPRPRIIRHKYNLFQPWDCELDIGDPQERLIERLKATFDATGFIDGKFNGSGKFSGYDLEDLSIDNMKINSLEANKITTQYAKITTAQIEDLEVGGNVTMGPYATLGWAQIPDVPLDIIYQNELNLELANYLTTGQTNTRFNDLLTYTNLETVLGQDYIVTGKIVANQIAAGRISADYLSTDISRVNDILHLGGGYEEYSSITFDGIGGIDAFDDVLHIGAIAGITFQAPVSFQRNVDFDGVIVSGLEGYTRPYYSSNFCYVDAGSSGIAIRNANGTTLGTIAYTIAY